MLSKRESAHIIISIITMGFVISFSYLKNILSAEVSVNCLKILSYSAIIILTAVFARKLSSAKRDIEIEHKIWEFQRWWIHRKAYFKKPIPMGLIFPILLSIISTGFIKCLTFLQFDSEALPSKIAKKYGPKRLRFAEINEWDLGVIAFWGLAATLALSLIAHYLGFAELAKYSLYYSMWNLIPFSQLDGMKILLGSAAPRKESGIFAPLYIFAWIIALIVLFIVLI